MYQILIGALREVRPVSEWETRTNIEPDNLLIRRRRLIANSESSSSGLFKERVRTLFYARTVMQNHLEPRSTGVAVVSAIDTLQCDHLAVVLRLPLLIELVRQGLLQ